MTSTLRPTEGPVDEAPAQAPDEARPSEAPSAAPAAPEPKTSPDEDDRTALYLRGPTAFCA